MAGQIEIDNSVAIKHSFHFLKLTPKHRQDFYELLLKYY